MIVICDLDGTLSDTEHRVHFLQREPQDWDGFFAASKDDPPIWPVIHTVRALKAAGHEIHVLTGRSDSARDDTIAWFEQFGVPCDRLLMRRNGDGTADEVLKRNWFEADYSFDDVLVVIDDRKAVVDMWRGLGLVCLQPAPGDF